MRILSILLFLTLLLATPTGPLAVEEGEQQQAGESPPAPGVGEEELEEFVPSEELTADSAISFPVDI